MSGTQQLLEDRGGVYGPPITNHRRIASLWSTYLEHDVTPAQAAMCMALVKVARLIQTPDHADSVDDLAGYAECYRQILEAEAREGSGKHRRES
jgi:hypothetical protein